MAVGIEANSGPRIHRLTMLAKGQKGCGCLDGSFLQKARRFLRKGHFAFAVSIRAFEAPSTSAVVTERRDGAGRRFSGVSRNGIAGNVRMQGPESPG